MISKYLIPLALLIALVGQPVLAENHGHDSAHEDKHTHEHHDNDEHAEHENEANNDAHLSTMGDLRLLHGWTRATRDDSALVFVEIENAGTTPVTLTGVTTDLAKSATLVGFTLKEGEPSYPELPALPVAPSTEMVLVPQGVALRLDGLSRDLVKGDSFEVIVTFEEGEVAVNVEVEAADATQHSHAGHAH